jgi:hypothetical protein
MGLLQYLLLCVVVGIVVWLVNTYLPIDPSIKRLITIAAVVVLVLILLAAMGLFGGADIPIPRIR